MSFGKLITNIVVVVLLLFIFSYTGAITFPTVLSVNNPLGSGLLGILFFLLSMVILVGIGSFLGSGIRSMKKPFEALVLAYISALIVGGILALFTLLNFPYSAHINLYWLGRAWYDPWLTVFLIGTPIMLAFII